MNLVELDIRANDLTGPGFASALARAEALKKALNGNSLLGFDPHAVDSELSALKSKLQSHGIADLLDINMNAGQIEQQLMLLKRKVSDARISDLLDVNLDEGEIDRQLSALGERHILQFTPEFTGGVDLGNVPQRGESIPVSVTDDGVQAVVRDLGGLSAAEHDAAAGADDLAAAAAAAAGSGGGGRGGGVAALGAAAASSGRRLYGWWGILSMSVGGIALWHIALDGAIETLISVGEASAAAAVGIAAMVPASEDIYTHLKAVQTVNSALGSQIPPLTGGFQQLGQAMAPQTIEAYGGALNMVSTNSGVLARVAGEVVTGIDDVIARFDLWNAAQQHTGQLLQDGVGFLSQFTHILGEMGGALDNLARADPGTAHMLLDVVGAAAELLDVVTKLPTPILGAALALHSIYVWGNFAGGILGKLVGQVPGLSKLADILSHGFHLSALADPQVAAIALAVGLAADIAVNWDKADASARSFINTLNSGLNSDSASTAIVAISTDIGQLNAKIAQASSPAQMAQLSGTWNALGSFGMAFSADFKATMADVGQGVDQLASGHVISGLASFGDAVEGIFKPGQGQAQIVINNIAAYSAEIDKLTGQQAGLFTETGRLMQQGYSYTQSLGLMDLAGVKTGDSLQLMNDKVTNLEKGYANTAAGAGMLGNAVNAVTFASLQQSSQVSALNSAWDGFFTTVSGGESGFEGFAQQTIGLYQSMTTGGLKVTDSNGKVGASLALLASNAGGTAVSMNGLNSASLTARQTFVQSASAANSEMDSLTTLASAAGLGQQGTDLLTQANKDLVSALLPAAKGSTDMTTILYALAQRGGYQGADSFQQLAKWVGNTKDPMTGLQGIVTTLTKAAGNLTTDVQNLSTALGTTLNGAMATAMFTVSGGQQMLDNFANAVVKTGTDSKSAKTDALKLAEGFTQMTGSVTTAKNEFFAFAENGLHMTQAQADTLWKQTLPGLQGYIDKMHGKQLDIGITLPSQQVQTFQQQVDSLQGKTVTINAQVIGSGTLTQIFGRGYAAGGIVGHAADGGVRNGMVMVGELGPELAELPQGTRVWPHGIMPPGMQGGRDGAAAGGAGGHLIIELRASDSKILSGLQAVVREKGGDPRMFIKKVAFR